MSPRHFFLNYFWINEGTQMKLVLYHLRKKLPIHLKYFHNKPHLYVPIQTEKKTNQGTNRMKKIKHTVTQSVNDRQ